MRRGQGKMLSPADLVISLTPMAGSAGHEGDDAHLTDRKNREWADCGAQRLLSSKHGWPSKSNGVSTTMPSRVWALSEAGLSA